MRRDRGGEEGIKDKASGWHGSTHPGLRSMGHPGKLSLGHTRRITCQRFLHDVHLCGPSSSTSYTHRPVNPHPPTPVHPCRHLGAQLPVPRLPPLPHAGSNATAPTHRFVPTHRDPANPHPQAPGCPARYPPARTLAARWRAPEGTQCGASGASRRARTLGVTPH